MTFARGQATLVARLFMLPGLFSKVVHSITYSHWVLGPSIMICSGCLGCLTCTDWWYLYHKVCWRGFIPACLTLGMEMVRSISRRLFSLSQCHSGDFATGHCSITATTISQQPCLYVTGTQDATVARINGEKRTEKICCHVLDQLSLSSKPMKIIQMLRTFASE